MLLLTNDPAAHKGVYKMTGKNPFTTKETISHYFEKSLKHYLDDEFEDYFTEDDDYQPVCEDFDIYYCVSKWCEEHGFNLVSCEGEVSDDGYGPRFGRNW